MIDTIICSTAYTITEALSGLRWNAGVLQQQVKATDYDANGEIALSARIEWQDVPTVSDE